MSLTNLLCPCGKKYGDCTDHTVILRCRGCGTEIVIPVDPATLATLVMLSIRGKGPATRLVLAGDVAALIGCDDVTAESVGRGFV